MTNPDAPASAPAAGAEIPQGLEALGFIGAAEAHARFGELCHRVSAQHERFTITEHGKRVAVLIPPDELADLEDWAAIGQNLSNPGKGQPLDEFIADLRAGNVS